MGVNLIQDPGFETGTPWTMLGGAYISPGLGVTGNALITNGVGTATQPLSLVPTAVFGGSVSLKYPPQVDLIGRQVRAELSVDGGTVWLPLMAVSFTLYNVWTVQPFAFFSTTNATPALFRFRGVKGIWHLDNVNFEKASGGPIMVARWAAYDALIQQLKGISIGAAYWTDLQSKVYPVLATPMELESAPYPYLCVPLIDDATEYEDEATSVVARWQAHIYGYVNETNPARLDTTSTQAAANLHDDICKAIMYDRTLAGKARMVRLISSDITSGIKTGEPEFAEVHMQLEITQVFQRSDLGT